MAAHPWVRPNEDKNERRFPEFATLRGDMYEESSGF